jgi:hypothetical protein
MVLEDFEFESEPEAVVVVSEFQLSMAHGERGWRVLVRCDLGRGCILVFLFLFLFFSFQ